MQPFYLCNTVPMVPEAIGVLGRVLSIDDRPNVELNPTMLLREELAAVRRAALSVWRLRRG
jgi:hypothetical protein